MALRVTWNAAREGTPLGTDVASGGDDEIRNTNRDSRERLGVEHEYGTQRGHTNANSRVRLDTGRHIPGGAAVLAKDTTVNLAKLVDSADGTNYIDPGTGSVAINTTKSTLQRALSGAWVDEAVLNALGGQGFENIVRNGHFLGWSGGVSAAPDQWALDSVAGSAIAREGTTVLLGTFSAKLTGGTSAAGILRQELDKGAPALYGLAVFKGDVLTVGAWVRCSTASSARIAIDDGGTVTYSAYHSGTANTWEFLTAQATLAAGATAADILLTSAATIVSYFDGVTCAFGYNTPRLDLGPQHGAFPVAVDVQDETPTDYLRSNLVIQCGKAAVTATLPTNVTVTFPRAFAAVPYAVLVTASGNTAAGKLWVVRGSISTATAMAINVEANDASADTYDGIVSWLAIGQMV